MFYMIIEIITSRLDKANFVLGILTFFVLLAYTYFTYRIAEADRKPRVSFTLSQIQDNTRGHISFSMLNKSKVDVEVWAKVWVKIGENVFSDKGFYGDKSFWELEPFMQGKGHFRISNLVDSNENSIHKLFNAGKLPETIKLYIQIKYKKVGKTRGGKNLWFRSMLIILTQICFG